MFSLKEKTDNRSKELIHEGASLKMDITALEKERRHMHTLLCDLIYYLEEDSKYNTNRISTVVSASMRSALPEDLDLSDGSTDRAVPPKSALKKPTVPDCTNSGMISNDILIVGGC
jgi:hypothetical protein